jgi:hypothetical protein
MTGWWFIGSLGEASFFAAFFLVGVLSATTLVAWQLMSPKTQMIRIGYGFWLFFLVAISFIVIGTVGFWYRVLKVVTPNAASFQSPWFARIKRHSPPRFPTCNCSPIALALS